MNKSRTLTHADAIKFGAQGGRPKKNPDILKLAGLVSWGDGIYNNPVSKGGKMIKDIFHPTFNEQYELAKQQGDKRFGSECKHEKTKNGICQNCFRKVVTK